MTKPQLRTRSQPSFNIPPTFNERKLPPLKYQGTKHRGPMTALKTPNMVPFRPPDRARPKTGIRIQAPRPRPLNIPSNPYNINRRPPAKQSGKKPQQKQQTRGPPQKRKLQFNMNPGLYRPPIFGQRKRRR